MARLVRRMSRHTAEPVACSWYSDLCCCWARLVAACFAMPRLGYLSIREKADGYLNDNNQMYPIGIQVGTIRLSRLGGGTILLKQRQHAW